MYRSFYLLLSGLSLMSFSSFPQALELDTHKNNLSDFLKIEQKLNGELFKSETTYILRKGRAQPVMYKHKATNLPGMETNYFAFEKTGKIDYVLYEWDEKSFDHTKPNNGRPKQEEIIFIEKYKALYDQVSKLYGGSKHKGDINDTAAIAGTKYNINDVWEPNDSTEVELNLTLSNYYKQVGNITYNPTYRIRLYSRNINKQNDESETKISKPKLDSLNATFLGFVSNLASNNLTHARVYISDGGAKSVTDEQLLGLAKQIKLNEKMEIWMSGFQMAFNGSQFPMLQYKYTSDTNSVPRAIIKVIFDDHNKILGCQPHNLIK